MLFLSEIVFFCSVIIFKEQLEIGSIVIQKH
jgi:hypothetical protein